MFDSDSWFDWDPDPERASRAADPTLEPYASMSRPQLLDLMLNAKGGREWEFLQEYYLDTCSPEELAVGTEAFIQAHYQGFGAEELCYLEGSIELALQRRNGPGAVGRGRPAPKPVPGDARPEYRTGQEVTWPIVLASPQGSGNPQV